MVRPLPGCVSLWMGGWCPVTAGLRRALCTLPRFKKCRGCCYTASSVTGLPSVPSLPRPPSDPASGLPVLPPLPPPPFGLAQDMHVLHPFSVNCFDAGPVCLTSIAHAFNYHITVLRSGIKQAAHTARSRKAERCFLDDVSLPWGQQVAVMFQIVCTLTLDVPAVARGITDLHGVSPDVLLSSVPWGHANHTGVACGCRASDRTGAYVHAVMAAHGGPADPGCSLPCAHIKHAAECPPALLQDTADCSPAAVAPVPLRLILLRRQRCQRWSIQSWAVPFHTEHHGIGHHHNWPRAKWKFTMWRDRLVWTWRPHRGQSPGQSLPNLLSNSHLQSRRRDSMSTCRLVVSDNREDREDVSARDEAIKSGSESGGVKSPVPHPCKLRPPKSHQTSPGAGLSIESPIADSAKGWSVIAEVELVSTTARSGGPTGQSGWRHWPHCRERPLALACSDPGRYSKVTENCPRSIYHRAACHHFCETSGATGETGGLCVRWIEHHGGMK